MTGATLLVRVVPRAGRTALAGRRGDAIVIRLAAPPVEGAANAALVEFVAELLDRPRRDVAIVSGEKGRDKRLRIAGMQQHDLDARIAALVDGPGGPPRR